MTFKLWQFRMWFFLNEMEKNLRYEPYFSLKFWEKIFLILKTKIDWIIIIIQNKKNKKKILSSVELSLSILYERDFGLTSLYATIQRGKLNKNFLHFRQTPQRNKEKPKFRLYLHYFFPLSCCVISRKKSDGKEE